MEGLTDDQVKDVGSVMATAMWEAGQRALKEKYPTITRFDASLVSLHAISKVAAVQLFQIRDFAKDELSIPRLIDALTNDIKIFLTYFEQKYGGPPNAIKFNPN